MSTPLHSVPVDTPLSAHDPQAPPYSPTLINLNNRYNMSASSLTEALLLLSGMYISLVQPEPGPIKLGLHAVFPRTTASFRNAIIDPFTDGNKFRTFSNYRAIPAVFDIATSYTRSEYAPKELLDMLCRDVFPKNTVTIIYLNNHLGLQKYSAPAVRYLPRILESLGLPIISYDTQFSLNARPALSIQLAPTMGQMMDVLFAFLKQFSWTDFSFLCTLSTGCLDEIAAIRTKINDFKRKSNVSIYGVETHSYQLLSYVNFTDGRNKEEAKDKLKYELHKDSRINLVHGSGAEVKTIMDVAKELGLTGQEYVWIFTAASISISQENSVVDESYPLGSFVIGYDSSRDDMEDVVKTGVSLWLQALNSLVTSPDFEGIDFKTGFSCNRVREAVTQTTNTTTRSSLFWKYGEILYKYILKSKLPGGLKFDEYGVLEANRFWIRNIQSQDHHENPSSDYDRRNRQHSHISGGSDSYSPHDSAHGVLTERSSDTQPVSQGYTKGHVRDSVSPRPWRNGFRLPVPRHAESMWTFQQDQDAGSEGQNSLSSLDRDYGSSRESELHQYHRVYSENPRPNDGLLERPLTRGKVSRSVFRGRDSSLHLSKNKDRASPFSGSSIPRFMFSKDRRSGISSRVRSSVLSWTRTTERRSPIHKHRRSSFPRPKEDPGYSSVISETASIPRVFSSSHDDLFYNATIYKTALSSPVEASSSLFPLSGNGYSKFTPSSALIISNGNDTYRVSRGTTYGRGSNNKRKFDPFADDSSKRSSHYNKIRRRESVIGYTSNHASHYNTLKQIGGYLTVQPRSSGVPMGDAYVRSRRAVMRKQITKKIADWNGHNLSITGIVWPGGSSKPPKGRPDKYILRVVTWKEDPHVIYLERASNGTDDAGSCDAYSLPCKVYNRNKLLKRTNGTKDMCCTGLCIDLLKKLGEMLHFEVELSEVHDGSYGSPLNKNLTDWNGMLGMLINNEADMAIGALSITPERSVAVDFSVPFLQTGIAIIVAIREGVISPTAFLEPYDYPSWSLILLFSVHATGASIFIFEWLSPYGLNQGKTSLSVHKFSLFRSFWLIWAMLFGASVSTDQPKGIASRFLANIWALFAVVFCASYTANLAAFMITKDDFYDLSGIQDWRLKNPHHRQPPFKFATIANSSTDLNIEKNYKEIYRYMKSEEQTDVKDAIKNLKEGRIQAFIYDSTTLEYEVGKDDFCKLKTVGKRIAETGYGVAFPRRSQWVEEVNKALLRLQENGDIERLQKFWLAGACHKKKEPGISSHTLGILNFTSAFILLGAGVVLGIVLLILEHMYFRFGRQSLKKWDKHGCCSLVSLSMGQSLTFEQSVMEAIDYHKHHKCKDPLCETQLWKIKYDLDIALLKISQLRKQIAYSASVEVVDGRDEAVLSRNDSDITPYQNGTARRRRQQASDTCPANMDRSANQPLLSLEGKSAAFDDDMPRSQSAYTYIQLSPSSSFSVARNRIPARGNSIPLQSIHRPYCEKHTASRQLQTSPDSRPAERLRTFSPNKIPAAAGSKTISDLDLHPLSSSYEKALSGYVSLPDEMISTACSCQPQPLPRPSLLYTQPLPVRPHQGRHQGDVLLGQDTGTRHLLSSLNDKHFVEVSSDISDSPSSFSDESRKHLQSPCVKSKFLNKTPSMAASLNIDCPIMELSQSTETSERLNDSKDLPYMGYTDIHCNNAQPNYSVPSTNSRHAGELSHVKLESNLIPTSRTHDINNRQVTEKITNTYANVEEIIGRETSF